MPSKPLSVTSLTIAATCAWRFAGVLKISEASAGPHPAVTLGTTATPFARSAARWVGSRMPPPALKVVSDVV